MGDYAIEYRLKLNTADADRDWQKFTAKTAKPAGAGGESAAGGGSGTADGGGAAGQASGTGVPVIVPPAKITPSQDNEILESIRRMAPRLTGIFGSVAGSIGSPHSMLGLFGDVGHGIENAAKKLSGIASSMGGSVAGERSAWGSAIDRVASGPGRGSIDVGAMAGEAIGALAGPAAVAGTALAGAAVAAVGLSAGLLSVTSALAEYSGLAFAAQTEMELAMMGFKFQLGQDVGPALLDFTGHLIGILPAIEKLAAQVINAADAIAGPLLDGIGAFLDWLASKQVGDTLGWLGDGLTEFGGTITTVGIDLADFGLLLADVIASIADMAKWFVGDFSNSSEKFIDDMHDNLTTQWIAANNLSNGIHAAAASTKELTEAQKRAAENINNGELLSRALITGMSAWSRRPGDHGQALQAVAGQFQTVPSARGQALQAVAGQFQTVPSARGQALQAVAGQFQTVPSAPGIATQMFSGAAVNRAQNAAQQVAQGGYARPAVSGQRQPTPATFPRATPAAINLHATDTVNITAEDNMRVHDELMQLEQRILGACGSLRDRHWLSISMARQQVAHGMGVA